MKVADINPEGLKIEDYINKKFQKKPKVVDFASAADNDIWDFGHSQEQLDEAIEKDGFVYKCIADCSSQGSVFQGYGFYIGRNIIERIMKMQPFGHLKSKIITIYYPEAGLSPEWQSAFVYSLTQHPDFDYVEELRIMTRNPFFVSDCKSGFCRVIKKEFVSPVSGMEDYEYFIPEIEKKDFKRLVYQRQDFILSKPDRLYAVYLNAAGVFAQFIGECDNYVYWLHIADDGIKRYRTPHLDFWYKLNGLWIDRIPLEEFHKVVEEKGNLDEFFEKHQDKK